MQNDLAAETRPAVRALRFLLEQKLRVRAALRAAVNPERCHCSPPAPACRKVTLPDGRVLVGQLQCADKQGNLVLHNTREYLPVRCVRRCCVAPALQQVEAACAAARARGARVAWVSCPCYAEQRAKQVRQHATCCTDSILLSQRRGAHAGPGAGAEAA